MYSQSMNQPCKLSLTKTRVNCKRWQADAGIDPL